MGKKATGPFDLTFWPCSVLKLGGRFMGGFSIVMFHSAIHGTQILLY